MEASEVYKKQCSLFLEPVVHQAVKVLAAQYGKKMNEIFTEIILANPDVAAAVERLENAESDDISA
jgi:hypothetical protein